jgi:two-component system, NtrC family, sensor kinase
MKGIHTHLLLLFFLATFTLQAQVPATLRETNTWQNIGKSTSFFQDAQFLTADQVLKPDVQSQFKPYAQDAPNFASIEDAVWFRFDVIKETEADFYLQLGSAFIDSIALYAVTNGQIKEVQLSGDNYLFSQRAVKVTTFLFPFNIPKGGTQTYLLRAKTLQPFFFPMRTGTLKVFMEDTHKLDFLQGIYLGFMLLMILYNLFVYFSTRERIYLYYVAYVACITMFMSTIYQFVFEYAYPNLPILNEYAVAYSALTILTATIFTRRFLHTQEQAPRLHQFSHVFVGLSIVIFILQFTPYKIPALMLAQGGIMLMAIFFLIVGVTVLRKGFQPAKYYLVAWSFLILGFIAAILESVNILPVFSNYINAMQVGSAIEVALLSFALADRINMYKKQREEAQAAVLKAVQEQAELIKKQNIVLEEKVNERTHELSETLKIVENERGNLQTALTKLEATQAQLIQSEKLASLGELTAGIAHEIQNPLNFVNNFSELSVDLVKDLKEEMERPDMDKDYIDELFTDLRGNQEKINHHGKRASSIVKGMLEHSRASTGIRELTDINKLADEYLRLSYHGLRAKDKNFNADFKTDFQESLHKIEVIPQDMGRVLLNLFNNAFYAVNEKKKKNTEGGYQPTVLVSTQQMGNQIIIKVRDNGTGMPESVKAKVFQPFFTTKPTGSGTGLGLSISYDIVTKGHGGRFDIETKEGEFTEFIIQLPYL